MAIDSGGAKNFAKLICARKDPAKAVSARTLTPPSHRHSGPRGQAAPMYRAQIRIRRSRIRQFLVAKCRRRQGACAIRREAVRLFLSLSVENFEARSLMTGDPRLEASATLCDLRHR